MKNYKLIGGMAVFWLIVIRMSIGWHLMYEGLWKVHSMTTAAPWTSAGYLRNSQGPLRDTFREMTGDPDELGWLDYDTMIDRWEDWLARFKAHHPDLTEQQLEKIHDLVYGPDEYRAELHQLPEGVEIPKNLADTVRFEDESDRLILSGDLHLTPREREQLLSLVDIKEALSEDEQMAQAQAVEFHAAVLRLYALSSRLSYKDQLMIALKRSSDDEMAIDTRIENLSSNFGNIQLYRQEAFKLYPEKINRYEQALARAEQAFQYDHLEQMWADLQQLRSKLVGPIKSLTKDLHRDVERLLTSAQLARGPVPEPWTQLRLVDTSTMWGLVILGGLLIAGLFSRLSAFAAAGLLTLFYLAMPPWPGVPQLPGPQHALIVNQHLIEVLVLLLLAMIPTGKWFGVDAMFGRSPVSRERNH